MAHIENDRWRGEFAARETGNYVYTLAGWVNHFATWQRDLQKKYDAGQDIHVDILIGIDLIKEAAERAPEKERAVFDESIHLLSREKEREKIILHALSEELRGVMDRYPDMRDATRYGKELPVAVERLKALFSTWYEMFPRSCSREPGRHGTFKDCEAVLPEIQRMGFDVLYLPPIHPIGKTNRKGKNNTLQVTEHDVGSPWAIGSEEGGHKAVHPELGTLEDFRRLVGKAKEYGMEVAMDIALQCSPDHPYVKEHPQWFKWRPDGSVQYAENPPKKYEDILPLNFETEDWEGLWNEIKEVFLFWIENGIRIFRVDNPHTKPFRFWNWLITGDKGRISRSHLPRRGIHKAKGHVPPRKGRVHPVLHLFHLEKHKVGDQGVYQRTHHNGCAGVFQAQLLAEYSGHSPRTSPVWREERVYDEARACGNAFLKLRHLRPCV